MKEVAVEVGMSYVNHDRLRAVADKLKISLAILIRRSLDEFEENHPELSAKPTPPPSPKREHWRKEIRRLAAMYEVPLDKFKEEILTTKNKRGFEQRHFKELRQYLVNGGE